MIGSSASLPIMPRLNSARSRSTQRVTNRKRVTLRTIARCNRYRLFSARTGTTMLTTLEACRRKRTSVEYDRAGGATLKDASEFIEFTKAAPHRRARLDA